MDCANCTETSPRKEKAEFHGESSSLSHSDVWAFLNDLTLKFGKQEAFVSLGQQDPSHAHQGWRLSFQNLHDSANLLASWLIKHGYARRKYLLAVVSNCNEWAIFFWTAARLRIPFVQLDMNKGNPGRFLSLLLDPKESIVVVQNEIGLKNMEELGYSVALTCSKEDTMNAQALQYLYDILADSGPRTDQSYHNTKDDLQNQDGLVETSSPSQGCEIAVVLFTSGTTGIPKACYVSATNIISRLRFPFGVEVSRTQLRTIMILPLSHVFSMNEVLRTWSNGGCVVMPGQRTMHDISSTITDEACNYMPAVKSIFDLLIQHSPTLISPMRCIQLAGDSVPEVDIERYEGSWGIPVLQTFGMTESGPITGWVNSDVKHYGSGVVLPGMAMRICSSDSHQTVLNIDEIGELHISGDSVISGYGHFSTLQDDSFYVQDGRRWFITGDRAFIDKNGVLTSKGRLKDLIKRGGVTISPMETETIISLNCQQVTYVVGIHDQATSEQIPAIVTKEKLSDETQSELRNVLRTQMGWKYEVCIVSLAELQLDNFPQTPLGKLNRPELANLTQVYLEKYFQSQNLVAMVASFLQMPIEQIVLDELVRDRLDSIDIVRLAHRAKIEVQDIYDKTFRDMIRDLAGVQFGSKHSPDHNSN